MLTLLTPSKTSITIMVTLSSDNGCRKDFSCGSDIDWGKR